MMGPPPRSGPQHRSATTPIVGRGVTNGGFLVILTTGFLTCLMAEQDNSGALWILRDGET